VSRIAYVDGRYQPLAAPAIAVEDRGYQFADGVYEVIPVLGGRLVDAPRHLARLGRSLAALAIPWPLSARALAVVMEEVRRRNRVREGMLYLQVTRGVARREHPFPAAARPVLVVTARSGPGFPSDLEAWAVAAITHPDQRWARCDIKSTALLPNVLARQAARAAGAYEAILVDGAGMVTEGAASTVWAVDAAGVLRTRPLDWAILPGCTREALLELLAGGDLPFAERALALEELRTAREIFLTSATSFIRPVTVLDDAPVGEGRVGPVARALHARLAAALEGGGAG
jgi:D-alanine transaminase